MNDEFVLVTIGALVGFLAGYFVHKSLPQHPETETTSNRLARRPCTADGCKDWAAIGSDFCASHWWQDSVKSN